MSFAQRKTATEQASRRTSRISVDERVEKSELSRTPSPPSPVHHTPEYVDEDGFVNDQISHDVTITSPRPQKLTRRADGYTYPAPIPIHPPEEPGALSSRLSSALEPADFVSHSSTPPTEADSASAGMPDVGHTRFQTVQDVAPPTPVKPRGGRPMSYREETEAITSVRPAERLTSPPRHMPPTQQQNGPIRGRPLIFAAMEATATSEADNIDVEPEVLNFIGDLSAAAKTEEGYSAYAYGNQNGYQTPNQTPPPPPDKDADKQRRRKLSKPRRHESSRKADVTNVDQESDRQSPVRNGSYKATPPRHMDVEVAHRPVHHSSSSKSVSANGMTSQQSQIVVSSGAQEEHERRSNESDRQARKKSVSQDSKVHRSSRDAVKPLTDKQMEKLNNRLSSGGVPTRRPEPEVPVQQPKRYAEEEQAAAYPPPPHKLSYKSTHPFIPMHPGEPTDSHIPQSKRSHRSNKLSLSRGSLSRHALPQLPTPPDEATTAWSKNGRREKRSPPPDHRQDVHEHLYDAQPHDSWEPELDVPLEPQFYSLLAHVADPILLEQLLIYLSFYEWLTLACVSKAIRQTLYEEGREPILERYLRTVGYTRWRWNIPEPLVLTVEVRSRTQFRHVIISCACRTCATTCEVFLYPLINTQPSRPAICSHTLQSNLAPCKSLHSRAERLHALSYVCVFKQRPKSGITHNPTATKRLSPL